VAGEISPKIREEIRKTVEEEKKDCIIVASTGTFSTGTNIINLHNIIQAHPTKSKIKILQSIGRGLRKGDDKTECTYFDISDDLTWKSKKNYTYNHFLERLKIYVKSGFNYKLYKVDLEQ
jgi:superfamily II DNA or RNA helicase